MAKKVVLQAGHIGRTSGNVGAPGEQELNKRITDRLASILRGKGFEIKQTDAYADSDTDITKVDWDLFLALHGDADIYGTGGGMVDFPEPASDGATAESQRIAKCITEEYFKHSEIVNHPERSNANTRFYYVWDNLTSKTPCVIVEMGVVQDAHDKVLLGDTDRIANALARGVCKAFGVAFDPPPPIPPEPPIVVPEPPSEVTALREKLFTVKSIIWGKGFVWSRMNKLKGLLPR